MTTVSFSQGFWPEAEAVARYVARVTSVVAAVALGLAFVVDQMPSHGIHGEALAFTLLVALAVVGYAIAWRRKWELAGALIAVFGVVAAAVTSGVADWFLPAWAMIGVAAPAALHLVAVFARRRQAASRLA